MANMMQIPVEELLALQEMIAEKNNSWVESEVKYLHTKIALENSLVELKKMSAENAQLKRELVEKNCVIRILEANTEDRNGQLREKDSEIEHFEKLYSHYTPAILEMESEANRLWKGERVVEDYDDEERRIPEPNGLWKGDEVAEHREEEEERRIPEPSRLWRGEEYARNLGQVILEPETYQGVQSAVEQTGSQLDNVMVVDVEGYPEHEEFIYVD